MLIFGGLILGIHEITLKKLWSKNNEDDTF